MDTLTFNSHSTDTALIILVKGQIDLPTQDRFEEVVTTALASSSVVVDLSQVSFLSVSGLRSLIACHRGFHSRPGIPARAAVGGEPSLQASVSICAFCSLPL